MSTMKHLKELCIRIRMPSFLITRRGTEFRFELTSRRPSSHLTAAGADERFPCAETPEADEESTEAGASESRPSLKWPALQLRLEHRTVAVPPCRSAVKIPSAGATPPGSDKQQQCPL